MSAVLLSGASVTFDPASWTSCAGSLWRRVCANAAPGTASATTVADPIRPRTHARLGWMVMDFPLVVT